MDFKVLITGNAITDLKGIVEFVAQDDSDAAIRLGEKLVDHALSLASMPQRFPFHGPAARNSQNDVAALSDFLHM